MTATITSIAAYRELRDSGKELSQCARIALYVEHTPGCTRAMISRGTGLPEARVSARVNKLVKDGVLREQGTARDGFTHQLSKRLWSSEGENLSLPI